MSFDYRAEATPTPRAATRVMLIAGLVLLMGCGLWMLVPLVAVSGQPSTQATVVSYAAEFVPAPGNAPRYRPTLRYTVAGREYTFTAPESVTAVDRRALPPGGATTVRYDADDPSSAQWLPGGSVLAVNMFAVVGVLLGFGLTAASATLASLNRHHERMATARPCGET